MVERNASDLFFSTGAPPNIKIEGKSMPVGNASLPPGAIKDIAYGIMSEDEIEEFEREKELNFAYQADGIGRFRANVFYQRGQVGMVMRHIKTNVPEFETLKLPKVLTDVVMERQGLVLVCGPTGSGKSTTLGSMIDFRNRNATGHMLTIEDPIEFLHSHKKSIIDQREIGSDTDSYHNALKNALRQAPDVILIGEIRDAEAMDYALNFAQTGHLCLATLHANNTKQVFERIRNFFAEEVRDQIMFDLSLSLRAVINQRLVIGKDSKRLAATEVMLRSPDIVEHIQKGELSAIPKTIEKNTDDGMMTFDQSLFNLYKVGLIDEKTALLNADSRTDLGLRMRLGGGAGPAKKAPPPDSNDGGFGGLNTEL
jgi:twitching motility protein PilU